MSDATRPTATFLGPAHGFALGDARLYALSVPIQTRTTGRTTDRVIVTVLPADEEGHPGDTTVMAATASGLVDTYGLLPGSLWRVASHRRALDGLGYELVSERRAA